MVPRYIGEAAHRILAAAAFFTPTGVDLRPNGFLHDRQPFTLGPFQVTPYLSDHSAFDAYGLLAEAGDRSLYYSPDLRGHGRKRSLFERLLTEPPNAHTLLLEGTRIAEQPDDTRGLASETDVENAAASSFGAQTGSLSLSTRPRTSTGSSPAGNLTVARNVAGGVSAPVEPLSQAVCALAAARLQNLCGVVTPRSVGSTPAPLREEEVKVVSLTSFLPRSTATAAMPDSGET